ncbi:MAG: ComEC/Rec2 family competence protein [Treponema sp.]|jgi:competence protein ComEC|nr:ComEC/Rec2 family competence protein [Treponema sp.]
MTGTLPMTPPAYGALGAALGYYGFSVFSRSTNGILLLAVTLLSLTQVLAHSPELLVNTPNRCQGLRRGRVYTLALVLGLSLGLAAGSRVTPLWFGIPVDQVRGISGTLQEDPRSLHERRGSGYLSLRSVSGNGGLWASARGTLLVFFPDGVIPRLGKEREFGRGSGVYIEGILLTPDSGKARWAFRAQAVHVLRPAPALEQIRTQWRMQLTARFAEAPWGGLAGALLLGVKDNLDTELSQAYQAAGCSHVLALSGMHLAIFAGTLAFFLKKSLGRKAAALLSACCVIGYVYLAGNLPSLERAAIMYLLGTAAVLGSLPKPGPSLLGMSFLIQILLRPDSGQSVSCILSYLALGGILFLGKAIHELIQGLIPEIIAQPLAVSLGAFVATAPGIASCFGVLRPIGILAGLIIVPLTTVFMLGALAALILPWSALGQFLQFLYDVLNRLVSLAAVVPGISVAATLSSAIPVSVLSLGVSAGLMVLSHRQKTRRNSLAPFD